MTRKLDHLASATGRPINTTLNLWASIPTAVTSPTQSIGEQGGASRPQRSAQKRPRSCPGAAGPGPRSPRPYQEEARSHQRSLEVHPPPLPVWGQRRSLTMVRFRACPRSPHSSGTGSHSAAHSHLPRSQRTHSTAARKNPPLTACRRSWLDSLLKYPDWLTRLEWQKQLL